MKIIVEKAEMIDEKGRWYQYLLYDTDTGHLISYVDTSKLKHLIADGEVLYNPQIDKEGQVKIAHIPMELLPTVEVSQRHLPQYVVESCVIVGLYQSEEQTVGVKVYYRGTLRDITVPQLIASKIPIFNCMIVKNRLVQKVKGLPKIPFNQKSGQPKLSVQVKPVKKGVDQHFVGATPACKAVDRAKGKVAQGGTVGVKKECSIIPTTVKKPTVKVSTNCEFKTLAGQQNEQSDRMIIQIPSGVEEILPNAFKGCPQLYCVAMDLSSPPRYDKQNTFPEGCHIVDSHGLYVGKGGISKERLGEIKTVVIPYGVTEIAEGAFKKSTVQRVIMPDSVKKIGAEAFYSCKSLTEVVFPATLQEIGSDAFAFTGLKEITIKKVGKIGYGAFSITPLKKAAIWEWEQVDNETYYTFSGCENLTYLSLPAGMKQIPSNFCHGCKNLESIRIPYGVERISFNAFDGCKKLKQVELPSTLKEIGTGAFRGTAIARIELPSGLQCIRNNAFADCEGLAFPHLPEIPKNCKVEQGAFMNMPKNSNPNTKQSSDSLYGTVAGAVYRSMYKF